MNASAYDLNDDPQDDFRNDDPEGVVSLDAIALALTARGFPASVEHTGGGCATLYAGPPDHDGTTGRYSAVVGPGWFHSDHRTDARATTLDLYWGPDDDGRSEPVKAAPDMSEADVIDAITAYIGGMSAPDSGRGRKPDPDHADYIRRLVDEAPPLDEEQRARLARLLRGHVTIVRDADAGAA